MLHHETDGSISTSVYVKTTHTGGFLDFHSQLPVSHKRSIVSTLLSRARSLSSSPESEEAENERVLLALKCNGYPGPLISQQAQASGWTSAVQWGAEVFFYCDSLCTRCL
jgi:hypothetical protein